MMMPGNLKLRSRRKSRLHDTARLFFVFDRPGGGKLLC